MDICKNEMLFKHFVPLFKSRPKMGCQKRINDVQTSRSFNKRKIACRKRGLSCEMFP